MELLRKYLVWLIQVLLRRWFLLFTLYALYYYHVVLDRNMSCSCESQGKDCWVFLLVPGLVLFVVQLWVDVVFARGLKNLGSGVQVGKRVAPVLIRRVLEAGFVGLLWIQSVLLDGDWYVCCGRGNIRCARYDKYYNFNINIKRPDSEEIHNESQVIGLLLVFVVFLVAAILSWLPWGRWQSTASCGWTEAMLEEAELTLSQQIRMVAQNQLNTRLDQSGAEWRKWEELEKELLLDQSQAKTQIQTTVLMSSLTNGETE